MRKTTKRCKTNRSIRRNNPIMRGYPKHSGCGGTILPIEYCRSDMDYRDEPPMFGVYWICEKCGDNIGKPRCM